jgi:hypothetical protein
MFRINSKGCEMRISSESSEPSASSTVYLLGLNHSVAYAELTTGKWFVSGQLIKWVTEMPRNVLTIWIKSFGAVELSESVINTGIPGPPPDIHGESDGRGSQTSGFLRAEKINTVWIKGPVGWTVGPAER